MAKSEVTVRLRDDDIELEVTSANSRRALTDLDKKAESPENVEKRDAWGNKAEFMLATIGLAVGLGNIWRFPYLCQKNGGGAFLVPFFIFMVIEGLPLFFIELGMGQRFRKVALTAWHDIHPSLSGIGVGCIVVSFMLCIYYIIVITWCSYYFFISFTKKLPWQKDICPRYNEYKTLKDVLASNVTQIGNFSRALYNNETLALKKQIKDFPDCCIQDTPQWYWYNKALQVSSGFEDVGSGMVGHLVGCLVFAWVAVFFCIMKGVKTSGKVVYFTAVFPYLVLFIMFFRGVTLPGALHGIKVFFTPDWSRLLEAQIWMDAATQIFFSLSLGFGALIAFASYNPVHNNMMRDAYIVVISDCLTAVLGGVVIFSILGHRHYLTGIPVEKVGSGPGLAFVTISDAILLMDVSPLWAILFFFMLILLGIDSEFGTLEAAVAPFFEMKIVKMKKPLFIGICITAMFFVGLSMVTGPGYYIFQIFDEYSVTIPLLVITLCQALAIGWIYGADKFADDIEFMTGKRPWTFWMFCWKYLSPLALIVILIWTIVEQVSKKPSYSAYVGCKQDPADRSRHPGSDDWVAKFPYPIWAQCLAVVLVCASCLPIPYYAIKYWPSNFKQGFKARFCSGIANYMPDPSSWKKRHNHKDMMYDPALPSDPEAI
ncbi:sodium-dependent neutral amino acid transporter B(0)AT1-like [Rhopilema esculentum]|uniref:sodium-dependent neutral amino acid transporter B(0)AT1-like n=1 Tax=Rhopilema esculentum TaxID=499914 RepID=UPI0031DEF95A|eukprot:gene340-10000_t